MTVMAVGPQNKVFSAPDTYMNKLVAGKECRDIVSLENSIEENLINISSKTGRSFSDTKVIVLDRPRNQYIIDELNHFKVQIELIKDGDIAASLRVAAGEADMYMGIGSAPEGVIGATAVKGLGGHFDGKLCFHSNEAKQRAIDMSKHAIDAVLDIDKLCESTNSMFIATGVCNGWIDGVEIVEDKAYTTTVIIDVDSAQINRISNFHSIKNVNEYIMKGGVQ